MDTRSRISALSDRVASLAGDAAGTVVDPRTGLGRLRSRAKPVPLALLAVGLAVAYLLGRRSGQSGQ